MKGKKKGKRGVSLAKLIRGFSLVELIVVLTIMAIIAALCAPNISAYVQAAKIQNYQTALDNLVGEVQTQLPQSRYWNWQEVQENAEAILRSDAARGVTESSSTDNSVTYTITNASTDGNITYEITITYANKNNTAQAVTVSGECSQFSVVKAEETCDVLLKTNYTDVSSYPMTKILGYTSDKSGWKSLRNRVYLYEEWKDKFDENLSDDFDYWKKYNFDINSVPNKSSGVTYINTTDYPANSVTTLRFDMNLFTTFQSTDNKYFVAYPWIQVQDGQSTGDQYSACQKEGTGFDNLSIYVGEENEDEYSKEENWKKWDDIFVYGYIGNVQGCYILKTNTEYGIYPSDVTTSNFSSLTTEAQLFYQKYFSNGVSEPQIKYQVNLLDKNGNINSRGWIELICENDSAIYPDYNSIQIYVDIPEYLTNEQFKDKIEYNKDEFKQSSEKYYDTTGLTLISTTDGDYPKTYEDSEGNRVILTGNLNYNPIQVYYKDTNYEIKEDDNGYYYESFKKVYLVKNGNYDYAYGNVFTNPNGCYIDWWEQDRENNWKPKPLYFESKVEVNYVNSSNLFYDSNVNKTYYQSSDPQKNYLSEEESVVITNDFDRVKYYQNGRFVLNMEDSGYQVGDIIALTFSKIDVDLFANAAENSNGEFVKTYVNSSYTAGKESGSIYMYNQSGYNAYVKFYDSSNDDANLWKVKRNYEDETVTIYVRMEWDTYPYLAIDFQGALDDFIAGIDINITWDKINSGSPIDIPVSLPMLTINGSKDYTNITLDWSKCDLSKLKSGGSELQEDSLGIKFTEKPDGDDFSYVVYDAEYKNCSPPMKLEELHVVNLIDALRTAAKDKDTIHIYCAGVSANDIECQILPEGIVATTDTPVTTTTPETTTTTTTVVAATETNETTESTIASMETSDTTTDTTVTNDTVVPDVTDESEETESSASDTEESTSETAERESNTSDTEESTETEVKTYKVYLDEASEAYCTIEYVSGATTEGSDYKFKLVPKEGYTFSEKVSAYANTPDYPFAAPVDGIWTLRIPAGDTKIHVDGIVKEYKVSFGESTEAYTIKENDEPITAKLITENDSFTFTVVSNEGYILENPIVTLDPTDAGTISGDNGTYTISNVTEDCQVIVSGVHKENVNVSFTADNGYTVEPRDFTLDESGSTSVPYNSSISFSLSYEADEYKTPEVSCGGNTLYTDANGVYTISSITDDISVSITGSEIGENVLSIHYIYSSDDYSSIQINSNGGNFDSIPEYGNRIDNLNSNQNYTITFLSDDCKLCIWPKYKENDWTYKDIDVCKDDALQLYFKTVDSWGQGYCIKTETVKNGLHDIWIYDGVCYTYNPIQPDVTYSESQMPVNEFSPMTRTKTISDVMPTVKASAVATTTTDTTNVSTTTTTTKSTTTTTTTTTNPIAASENGFNVGLDAESAEMCNITFTSPLFNDSGVCYFTITPKEGYTLSENYTVKVGTVKLARSGNYSAKSDQWYFWKSSGLTDYTIHVDGVTADNAS